MVVALSVIGFMALGLIYFVIKNQTLQRELNSIRNTLKSNDKQSRFLLTSVGQMAGELQKTYISRVNTAHKHKLISEAEHQSALVILNAFQFVLMRCYEHGETVEEALKKAMETSPSSIEEVNEFVGTQSNEVKLPWSKNQPQAFVTACHNLSVNKAKKSSSEPVAAAS